MAEAIDLGWHCYECGASGPAGTSHLVPACRLAELTLLREVAEAAEQWRQARDAYTTAHDSDREEGEWRDAMTRAHKELERAEDRLRQALDMAKEAGK